MINDIKLAIKRIDPTARFNIVNNKIIWQTPEIDEKIISDNIKWFKERSENYPSIADQLDTLYHGGFDAWKAEIKAVKDIYPKDNNGNN